MDALYRTQENGKKKMKNDGSRFQRSICKSSIYRAQKDIRKEKRMKKKGEDAAAGVYVN